MENIDDFMQRKFESDDPAERFPFREEYWEQAQVLIEAEELRRRKRRRFLFWWFFGGLLMGAGALWLWSDQPWQTTEMASRNGANQPGIVSPASPAVSNNAPDRIVSPATDMAQPTGASPQPDSDKNTKNIDHQQNRVEESLFNTTANQQKVKGNISASALPHKQIQTSAPSAHKSRATRTTGTLEPVKNIRSSVITSNPGAPSTENKTGQNAIVQSKTEHTPDLAVLVQMDAAATSADAQSGTDPALTVQRIRLTVLELPFPLAVQPGTNLVLKKRPKYAADVINPTPDRRFVFGAGASVSYWKNGPGYAADIFGNYRLNTRWSLSAGLRLRYVPLAEAGPLPDSSENISVQYRYSFGFERTALERTTLGLHYLEIPLAARWQQGRLGLEAGVAPGVLVQVRDRVTETRETSLTGLETLANRLVSGEKTNFRRIHFNTFVLAEWRVVSGLGLTLRGNYRSGSVWKPVEDVVSEKGAWGLDMGLRWRF